MTSRTITTDWITQVLTTSTTDWSIAVFKVRPQHCDEITERQLLTEDSLPKFYRAIDWTINASREKLKSRKMRFIPFRGGSAQENVAAHVHAFIEIPSERSYEDTESCIKHFYRLMCPRSLKIEVYEDLWMQSLDKSRAKSHVAYCNRYEGYSFLVGTEKLLLECKSCLF
jgi:hypothetical protein